MAKPGTTGWSGGRIPPTGYQKARFKGGTIYGSGHSRGAGSDGSAEGGFAAFAGWLIGEVRHPAV